MDTNTPAFASEDEEAAWCLSHLRQGDLAQKVVARDRLAYIFERRNLLDAAIECLESNVRDGLRDPRVYQRLAGIYRRQGMPDLADEALEEARQLEARLRHERPSVPRIDDLADEDDADHPLEAQTRPLPATGPFEAAGPFEPDDRAATGTGRTATVVREQPWYASPAVVTLAILLGGPFGIALLWLQTRYTRRGKWMATAGGLALHAVAAMFGWVVLQSNVEAILAASRAAPTPSAIGAAPAAPPALGPSLASPSPVTSPGGVTVGPAVSPSPPASPSPGAAGSAPGASVARVRLAGGTLGANMRERPSASSPVVKVLTPGGVLDVVGPDQQAEGRTWRHVRDTTGATGWVAAELLEPAT